MLLDSLFASCLNRFGGSFFLGAVVGEGVESACGVEDVRVGGEGEGLGVGGEGVGTGFGVTGVEDVSGSEDTGVSAADCSELGSVK